ATSSRKGSHVQSTAISVQGTPNSGSAALAAPSSTGTRITVRMVTDDTADLPDQVGSFQTRPFGMPRTAGGFDHARAKCSALSRDALAAKWSGPPLIDKSWGRR